MSQITRCPQCQTRFKVVDDQLRISDGWVRCGKCKSVFDALTHLVARPAPPADDAKPPVPAAPTSAAPAVPVAAPPPQAAAVPSAEAPVETVAAPAKPLAPQLAPAPGAVLVTENSLAVDPNANVPELSVLVFPRRVGFGDSGYVDSSWMSAYESDAAQPAPVVPPQASVAPAPSPGEAPPAAAESLESEWTGSSDQRPEGVRSGLVGFSAQDDLAELQAREGRLLEAIAEQKSKSETKVVALDQAGVSASALVAKAVLEPAPAPRADTRPQDAKLRSGVEEKAPLAQDHSAQGAIKNEIPKPEQDGSMPPAPRQEALYVEPALAARTVEPGKVEPALGAPHNYVAEIDAADAAATADSVPTDEPGFVRDAKRKAFWSKPSVIALTLLCAIVLLAGLLLQVAVVQRDQLLVQYPQWRPALAQVCRLAGCQLALPRDLQHVSIDSTSFNPIGARQFKLTVVLRNAGNYAVAVPALELSLNDAAEKLVLRRVLSAADLKAPAQLSAHGEWTVVVPIQVAETRQDVVGYRVLAFYP